MAQCTGHSSQTGAQCRNRSIPGGFVCRFHGGAAPQVKLKARERLEALVDPAIDKYAILLKSDQHATVLNAVKDILDRNGYKPTERTETVKYTPEDIERLDALSDDELAVYVALRRKVTEPRGGRGTAAPEIEAKD